MNSGNVYKKNSKQLYIQSKQTVSVIKTENVIHLYILQLRSSRKHL